LVFGSSAMGGTVIVPNPLVETGGSSVFPFGIFSGDSMRYQQVYAASSFESFGGPYITITALVFRPDANANPFSGTNDDLQVELSTTNKSPDALSKKFADNTGPDRKIVRLGAYRLVTAALDIAGPGEGKQFDIVMSVLPFTYNRELGNLLLDVAAFSGGQTHPLDGQSILGDAVSRVYSEDVNGAVGLADTYGLQTQFVATAMVPEPAVNAAWMMAAATCFARRKADRRDRRHCNQAARHGAHA
jgi:hypothetical protein